MKRIGIIGAGLKTKTHLSLLLKIPDIKLTGIYDKDKTEALKLSINEKVNFFDSFEELIRNTDALIVTAPDDHNFQLTKEAIKASKHVFLTTPFFYPIKDVISLIKLADEADVRFQIEKHKRFTPVFNSAKQYIERARIIEMNYDLPILTQNIGLSTISNNLTNILEIVFDSAQSNLKKVAALSISSPDEKMNIIHTRLEFENSTVGNITINGLAETENLNGKLYTATGVINFDIETKEIKFSKIEDQKVISLDIPVQESSPLLHEHIKFISDIEEKNYNSLCNEDEIKPFLVTEEILEKAKFRTIQA